MADDALASVHVLFIDDERDLVEDLPPVLRVKGLIVTATASIEDGLKLFEDRDFDAVLLDIRMPPTPDMDPEKVAYGRETGIEVARRMRCIKSTIPIIAFTVITDEATHKRMREAGIGHIMNKPMETEEIWGKLKTATARRSS